MLPCFDTFIGMHTILTIVVNLLLLLSCTNCLCSYQAYQQNVCEIFHSINWILMTVASYGDICHHKVAEEHDGVLYIMTENGASYDVSRSYPISMNSEDFLFFIYMTSKAVSHFFMLSQRFLTHELPTQYFNVRLHCAIGSA